MLKIEEKNNIKTTCHHVHAHKQEAMPLTGCASIFALVFLLDALKHVCH